MNNKRKHKGKHTIGILLPYICILTAVCLLTTALYVNIINSGLVQAITIEGDVVDYSDGELSLPIIITSDDTEDKVKEFPVIDYRMQWATLNVKGWEQKDIAIYYADNDDYETLSLGAVTPGYSEFCGRGRTVMAAHVNYDFREIEDTKVGTKVYVDTIYGSYKYKVSEIVIFDQEDTTYVYPDRSTNELVLYTCYPYDNNHMLRTQRIALICELTDGYIWDR